MRRPGLAILLAGGLLVALAIPALQMKSVTSGVDDFPQDVPVIQTYNKVKEVFPTEGVTATVVVEADDVRSGPAAAGIEELLAAVEGSDAFRPGTEVLYSEDGTVAQINIPTPGNGTDAPSTDALYDLRDEIIPATAGGVEGTTVNVTGDAAGSEDFANNLNSRLPLIFAFVFGLAFLLLLVTFRSIVIPIKAIVLNLLSVGAAYGVLVLVFQNGNLESLLGFTSNGGVTNWLPLFLFVVLFGLSMDYHVFILSRVKELYDRGMPTDEAVSRGISTTAGTVTSAAFVMVGVFLVFVTLEFIDFKELGLGLAVAVLIDATIIRGVLLPASMKVLGDWNWYLPSWLEWLPKVGAERDAWPPPDRAGGPAGPRRFRRAQAHPGSRLRRSDDDSQPRPFSPAELTFIVGVPLLWAILLLFHPGGEGDTIYLDVQDDVTRFLVVHVGMMLFIPLMAVVIYLLLRGVEGTAAWVSRIALVPFVVFYSAWEVLQGIGVGILVNELNEFPQAGLALREDLVQDFAEHVLIGPFSVFGSIGSLGLIVAAIAAGVALYRHAGAPISVPILFAISGLLITVHPPPYGPTGLALFIVAVLLYVRSQSTVRATAPIARPSSV